MTTMRRSRKPINQINVVPYIDVMLVLLVIFMVTAPLVNPGEIQLPTVGSALTTPVDPMEVTIRADGRYFLRDVAAKGPLTPIRSVEDLAATIVQRQAERPNQPVVINADVGTRYENVVRVLDVLQRNKVQRVGLLARPGGT